MSYISRAQTPTKSNTLTTTNLKHPLDQYATVGGRIRRRKAIEARRGGRSVFPTGTKAPTQALARMNPKRWKNFTPEQFANLELMYDTRKVWGYHGFSQARGDLPFAHCSEGVFPVQQHARKTLYTRNHSHPRDFGN